jgi:hypothetical protein
MTNDGSPGGLTKDTPFKVIYEPPGWTMWQIVEMDYDKDGAKDLVMTSRYVCMHVCMFISLC